MGLLVDLYRNVDGRDCSNGGISGTGIQGFCLTNVDGPFNPSGEYPAAKLKLEKKKKTHKKPAWVEDKNPINGGTFAGPSDSRFNDAIKELTGHSFYGAVAVHDRVEN